MNLWRKKKTAILRSLIALVLILSLTSCGGAQAKLPKDGSYSQKPLTQATKTAQLSTNIIEISPPEVIQELRETLEVYQPQVIIVTPKPDEVLQDNTVKVNFEVKDLPIYKEPQLELGPHLQVVLDNELYIDIYDLNKALVLPDLSPGTHTLRAFATRPWDESFKNDGAYAQTTFHVFTKTDDNNPDPTQPLLTYNLPRESYGAEPILLDFYLTNAPVHQVAQENPNDTIPDWRIRCTVNDESFILDRWQAVYLKGFKPGKNWVKLEFLNELGNPVKNAFNTTAKLITYQPKGKDTLSRIIRGELSAEQARAIVDPNYTQAKIPVAEPTPTPTPEAPQIEPTPQPQPIPEPTPTLEAPQIEPTPQPQPIPEPTPTLEAPQIEPTPQPQPIPKPEPEPTPTLEAPTTEETPQPQPQEEQVSIPEIESQPAPKTQPEKQTSRGFFNRFQRRGAKTPTRQAPAEPSSDLPPTLPEIVIDSTSPEQVVPEPEAIIEPQPQVTPEQK
jgi:hypothetical protein